MGKWFVVAGAPGNIVLGVYGSALRDMAEACVTKVYEETGYRAKIFEYSGARPSVGTVWPKL